MTLSLIGGSQQMHRLRQAIDKLKLSNVPVLLQGESGTGKDLVSRLIHDSQGPYFTFSCGQGLTRFDLEIALCGVAAGVFGEQSAGLFAKADGGTIFLDEVEVLGFGAQLQLLRVLQDQSFQPYVSDSTFVLSQLRTATWPRASHRTVSSRIYTTISVLLFCPCRLCVSIEKIYLS